MRLTFVKLSAIALTALALTLAVSPTQSTLAAQSNATPPATQVVSSGITYPRCDPNTAPTATIVSTAAATTGPTATPSVVTPPPTPTANPNAGYLGVAAQQVLSCGAQILDVRAGSPAANAGLQPGDVVVAADGQALTSLDQFRLIVQNHKPGDSLVLVWQRNTNQMTATATLAAVPVSSAATQAATAAG